MFGQAGQFYPFNQFDTQPSLNTANPELSKISQVTDYLYLCGVFAFDDNSESIKKNKIKYILSCVNKDYVEDAHSKLLLDNPDLVILYLPYNDDLYQNLWKINNKDIELTRYISNPADHDEVMRDISYYQNRPLIEIGYHFIERAISKGNNVLVHCMAGISRSASVIIYYLMKKYHLSYREGSSLVKSRRSITNPNESFQLQLKRYEVMREKFKEEHAKEIIDVIKKTERKR